MAIARQTNARKRTANFTPVIFAWNCENRTGHKTAQFGQPPGPVVLIVASPPVHAASDVAVET